MGAACETLCGQNSSILHVFCFLNKVDNVNETISWGLWQRPLDPLLLASLSSTDKMASEWMVHCEKPTTRRLVSHLCEENRGLSRCYQIPKVDWPGLLKAKVMSLDLHKKVTLSMALWHLSMQAFSQCISLPTNPGVTPVIKKSMATFVLDEVLDSHKTPLLATKILAHPYLPVRLGNSRQNNMEFHLVCIMKFQSSTKRSASLRQSSSGTRTSL